MRIGGNLPDVFANRSYWEAFAGLNEELISFEELSGQHLALECGEVELDVAFTPFAYELSLGLRRSSEGDQVVFAWDDDSHWSPDVLRWPELRTICRYAGASSPSLVRPERLLLILQRFSPICLGDDYTAIADELGGAWDSLGLFSQTQIAELVSNRDRRADGYRWTKAGEHWAISQDTDTYEVMLYSTRRKGSPEFPHALWQRFMSGMEERLRAPK